VARIVFNNESERKWLNEIIHPLVLKKAPDTARKKQEEYLIFDVPLLFEVNWKKEFSYTVTVWTKPELQRQRLLARGWSEAEIDRRQKSQMPAKQKLARADFGLINNGDRSLLLEQCQKLDNHLKG